MRDLKYLFLLGLVSTLFLTSCDDDDDDMSSAGNLTLAIEGLEDLGDDYAYEGWLMVDGSPISAGIFNVDGDGNLSQTSFEIDADNLEKATAYILTIEPSPDSDPAPSDVHILAGDFSGDNASLSVEHGAAIGTDFASATGGYILATPTDGGAMSNEFSGVWWLDPMAGPGPGLSLPSLPSGWQYEGWAVVDGTPLSTGRFTSVSGADDFSGFSGTAAGAPPFPGEDFLMNPPSGVDFPIDIRGGAVVISVEPVPDNSPAPFLLKPLVGMVEADASDHSLLSMANDASATNPSGTASK